jgi:heme exporter protein B
VIRDTLALLRKDLLLELRGRESLPAMALLAGTTMVVLHFALGRNTVNGSIAAGSLWVTLLFSATLGINRLFVAEQEEGGLDAVLLTPIDRTAILVAKTLTLFIYMTLLEAIVVPAFDLLLLGPPLWPALLQLMGVLALANFGIATVGAVVGAIAVQSRIRDLLAPLLALPLLVPALIASAKSTALLFDASGPIQIPGRWPLILALYALVFGLLGVALYDNLLDD